MTIEVQDGALLFAKCLLKMSGPEDVNHAAYILAKALVETHEELTTATAERDAYRAMLCDVIASASPNKRDHPSMSKQWERATELLRDGVR